jgi:sigma-B regulation protein RsbU (phosphoserine phosphatase)
MAVQILIVDDEPDIELLIRQRFRREAREGVYDFLFARNGADALLRLAAHPGIEVVLSDINMPVMDGLTLLGHLRALEPARGTVIVSAYGDMPNIRAAMNRGAFDFLTKPIDFQDFEVTIHKTVEQVRRLREAAADRDRLQALEHDLTVAAEIQRSFLPPSPPPFPRGNFSLAAAMTPAHAVGGDFYDYFLVPTGRGEQGLGLAVGDVSGKGMPAALFMAVSRTLLRAAALHGAPPGECLRQVNALLLRDTPSPMFVTLFYAAFDPRGGELRYCSGGHNPPFLLRAGGGVERLDGHDLLVGAFEDATYQTHTADLRPGDRLFAYTDGVTEALNPAGEEFGTARLVEVLAARPEASPDALVRAVFEAVREFAAGAPQSDDLTALALGYAGRRDRP